MRDVELLHSQDGMPRKHIPVEHPLPRNKISFFWWKAFRISLGHQQCSLSLWHPWAQLMLTIPWCQRRQEPSASAGLLRLFVAGAWFAFIQPLLGWVLVSWVCTGNILIYGDDFAHLASSLLSDYQNKKCRGLPSLPLSSPSAPVTKLGHLSGTLLCEPKVLMKNRKRMPTYVPWAQGRQ